MIGICDKLKLDFNKCKTAIMKLNNFATDYSFLTLKTGMKLKMPKTNADAAVIAASASSGTATGSATSTGATGTATGTGTAVASGNTVSYLVPHVVTAGETIYSSWPSAASSLPPTCAWATLSTCPAPSPPPARSPSPRTRSRPARRPTASARSSASTSAPAIT